MNQTTGEIKWTKPKAGTIIYIESGSSSSNDPSSEHQFPSSDYV